jgi:hypothetical protein
MDTIMSQDLDPTESVSQINLDIDLSEPIPSSSSTGGTASFLSRFTKQNYPEHYLLVTNNPVALTRANNIIQVTLILLQL